MSASPRAAVFLLAAAEDSEAVQHLREHLHSLLGKVAAATDVLPESHATHGSGGGATTAT